MSLSDFSTNSESEGQRLSQLYSAMPEGELQKVADDLYSLSDLAREKLREEIVRRGVDIVIPVQPKPTDEIEFQELVTLRKFRDLPEALLAKGSLDSAGIESFLGEENIVRLDWFISNLVGGIKLRVSPQDVEAAEEILNQPIPEDLDVDGVGEYSQPRCPKCQSLDVNFEELNKIVAYGTAYFNVPIPMHEKGWKCHNCGNRWEDDASIPPQNLPEELSE